MWGPFPRWLVVGFVVFIAAIELAFRMPDILLIGERYDAQKAEYQAKVLQSTTLLGAQISKADADAERAKYDATTAKFSAEAAALQPQLVAAQLAKASSDAITANYASFAAKFQPDLVQAQLLKAQNEGEASKYQPETMRQQLDKLRFDVKTAEVQPDLVYAQMKKTQLEAAAATYLTKMNELQLAKLIVDIRQGGSALLAQEQSGALSNLILSAINGALGISPPSGDSLVPPPPGTPTRPAPLGPVPHIPMSPPNPASAKLEQVIAAARVANDCRSMATAEDALNHTDYHAVPETQAMAAHSVFEGLDKQYQAQCRRR